MGVSKQTIRNIIAKLGLQSSLRKEGNTLFIDEKLEKLIYKDFNGENSDKMQSKSKSSLQSDLQSNLHLALRLLEKQNEQLSNELEVKNRQIESQQKNIDDLTSALSRQQMLHAGTMQQQLIGHQEEEINANIEKEKKPSIFDRLFNKK